ncbi:MAG TPA: hypothetical protein VFD92_02095 [Candidatus Binatia bacterium]|nr:hypothetical protein [Candidatus Binatia bacterium]
MGRRGRSPGPRSHAAGRSAAAVAIAPAIALAPAPGSAPNVDRLNALNLGLMLVSAAVAWVTPFEVLLLSYAVLGPLHYLTEISWLHDRRFFTTGRLDALALAALGALAFLARYVPAVAWHGWIVLALGLAAGFAFATTARAKLALTLAAVVASLAIERWTAGWLFLIVMLPTVIHVFFFTGLFILHGSVKSRSAWGYASFAVFLACGALLLFYRPDAARYAVGPRTAAFSEEFWSVIDQLALLVRAPAGWDGLVAIGRFLGFAYTYHYLNWFSKTGIIRWHDVGAPRIAAIGVLYVASLALYAYDYRVGLVALALLSLVHVFLELPLDVRTGAALLGIEPARVR